MFLILRHFWCYFLLLLAFFLPDILPLQISSEFRSAAVIMLFGTRYICMPIDVLSVYGGTPQSGPIPPRHPASNPKRASTVLHTSISHPPLIINLLSNPHKSISAFIRHDISARGESLLNSRGGTWNVVPAVWLSRTG